jgi:hypothetical protein
MSQPVWVLSVDLQTKTATFQSGLADAARSARGAFTDIKSGAGEAGQATGYSMMEARHSVMLLGEEFGIHLPRAVSSFIASIGPLGGILEAAFPFLAIIAGATILIEHLRAVHEAGEKLTGDQLDFLTASNNAFNKLDEKIIQAEIRSDELKNDHLGALKHQLELIDAQSMDELAKTFEDLAKSSDAALKGLEGHWYTFGKGSEGAEKSLTAFKQQYENLLSAKDDKGAAELLHNKIQREAQILQALKDSTFKPTGNTAADNESYNKAVAAHKLLDDMDVKRGAVLGKQLEAQQDILDVVTKMGQAQEKITNDKQRDADNAKTQTAHTESAEASAAARERVASQAKIAQEGLTADKVTAEAGLTVRRASLEERLQVELGFAGKERDQQLQSNAAEIAALDKTNKDYQNQLKAGRDKALEIEATYRAKVAELSAQSSVEVSARDLQGVESVERQKITATLQGTAARVAAIDASIKRVQSLHLQDTEFYRNLQNERIQAAQQETEEEGKLAEQAGIKQAESDERQGEIVLAAHRQALAVVRSLQNISAQQQLSDEIQNENLEFQLKQAAFEKEKAALDKHGKEYLNKLAALQNQELDLVKQHEAALTEIKQKADEERNQQILSAENKFKAAIADGLTEVLMGHETFAKMMDRLGDQVVSGIIKNTLLMMFEGEKQKLINAKKAATNVYGTVSGYPVVGPFLAPIAAAAAFTAVMAFQEGTDKVPGVGRGDSVPAMLEPGEGVVPGGVMDGLAKMARSGGFDQHKQQHVIHVHYAPNISTIDGDGMHDALEKNADVLHQHLERAVRRMNR